MKCGVCGGGIANTLVPHGAICEDDRKADQVRYSPEIDDLQRAQEEWLMNKQNEGDDGSGYCDACAGCPNCEEAEGK